MCARRTSLHQIEKQHCPLQRQCLWYCESASQHVWVFSLQDDLIIVSSVVVTFERSRCFPKVLIFTRARLVCTLIKTTNRKLVIRWRYGSMVATASPFRKDGPAPNEMVRKSAVSAFSRSSCNAQSWRMRLARCPCRVGTLLFTTTGIVVARSDATMARCRVPYKLVHHACKIMPK